MHNKTKRTKKVCDGSPASFVVSTVNVIDTIILLDIVIHKVSKSDASFAIILVKDVVRELLSKVVLILIAVALSCLDLIIASLIA